MLFSSRFVLLAAPLSVAVQGFAFNVFNAFQANPKLPELAQAQTGEKFSVRFDIGQKDQAHIVLDGLRIELLKEKVDASQKIGLPGADGPHPGMSSGALALKTLEYPSFVDLFGTQKVRFEKGCWEMIWKKDLFRGSIICGFDVPFGAKRNGAQLPQGRLYISFPVWTQEGLAKRQAEKFDAEARAKDYSKERDDELLKMQKESNLIKKALHYRAAAAAVEKIDFTGVRWMTSIPSCDEVVPIGDGLLMNTKGTVWNKDKSFFGGQHVMLGAAILAQLAEEDKEKTTLRP